MAILAAAGYGGYTIIKEKDLEYLRSGQTALYEVKRVIDGDTFELEDGEIVRLLAIDAPDAKECYFEESKEALRKLVEGKNVELRKDVTEVDKYGRLLRYIMLPNEGAEDSVFVQEYMVRGGYAITENNAKDRLYANMLGVERTKAGKEGKGLWGACGCDGYEENQIDLPPPSEECSIKGNFNKRTLEKTYLIKGCDSYNRVKVDPKSGDKYFCSEAEAQKVGFKKETNCPN